MRVNITWIDTVSYHGWYNKDSIDDIISGYEIESLGHLVGKTDKFTVIAKNRQKQSGEFGNLTYIPTKSIIKMKKLGG